LPGANFATFEIKIVFQTDADVAAEQDALRHHAERSRADSETAPVRRRRQIPPQSHHGFWRRGGAARYAETNLKERRRIDQTAFDHT